MTLDPNKRVFLIILDGYGIRDSIDGNAVKLARTPFLHRMIERWPATRLSASGEDVGLPAGQMGNSEVGHLNIGAGRIVYQDITRIDLAIRSGEFYSNPVILDSVNHAVKNGAAWHLIGLVSDGGVHSSLAHLTALINTAARYGAGRVFVHALTDGRDTSPYGAERFLAELQKEMERIGVGRIATVCGRYWGMDRDGRWQRTERAYRMLTDGEGLKFSSPIEAVTDSYRRGITDEFVEPSVIQTNNSPDGLVTDGDAVFFFNFRADRARQLTLAFTDPDFNQFPRRRLKLHYSTMTRYREDFDLPAAFPPHSLEDILASVLSKAGLTQFRIAETEKYAHVTYFFNGGEETPFIGEERRLIPSPKVKTYDQQPEMSAPTVAEAALEALDGNYNFILLNFANPDMVGHTGVISAAVAALEALDPLTEKLVNKALGRGFEILITADHGNCEQMLAEDGSPHTAHTTNLVPLVYIRPDGGGKLRDGGILADIAPTILDILGERQPAAMTGKSLLVL